MLNTANKNINIAVFRGGKDTHSQSLKEGSSLISSLKKHNVNYTDIYLDEEGNFIKNGVPVDPHNTFASVDAYVDTTDHYNHFHHDLARRMGVEQFLTHKNAIPVNTDKEGVYRILRQNNISVPKTFIIRRSNQENVVRDAKNVWVKFHTPLMVRPCGFHSTKSSRLIQKFDDLISSVFDFHNDGHDVQVISYKNVPVFSTAILPNYRGEEYYAPITVQTFVNKNEIPSVGSHPQVFIKADEKKKEEIINLTKKVAKVLQVQGPVCVDVICGRNGYVVVNVALKPSLREGGRFIQSLSSTGCDIGHYLKEKVENSNQC